MPVHTVVPRRRAERHHLGVSDDPPRQTRGERALQGPMFLQEPAGAVVAHHPAPLPHQRHTPPRHLQVPDLLVARRFMHPVALEPALRTAQPPDVASVDSTLTTSAPGVTSTTSNTRICAKCSRTVITSQAIGALPDRDHVNHRFQQGPDPPTQEPSTTHLPTFSTATRRLNIIYGSTLDADLMLALGSIDEGGQQNCYQGNTFDNSTPADIEVSLSYDNPTNAGLVPLDQLIAKFNIGFDPIDYRDAPVPEYNFDNMAGDPATDPPQPAINLPMAFDLDSIGIPPAS